MPRLTDVLVDQPRILFVGINPGLRSAQVGHHFAGPGNPFWRLLHASGLVPEPISSERDHDLARFRLALTNLCSRPTRSAAALRPAELAAGGRAIARKVRRLRPEVVAFVGLTVYRACVREPWTPGPGPKATPFEGARVFVLPNPSGLNASYPGFQSKLVWFRLLARLAGGREHVGSAAGPGGGPARASDRSVKEPVARARGASSRAPRRRGNG